MIESDIKASVDAAATRIYPRMPNYVGGEAELLVALTVGDADIEADRTVSFEEVAAALRRTYGKD